MAKIQWNSINENKMYLNNQKMKKIIHPPRLTRSHCSHSRAAGPWNLWLLCVFVLQMACTHSLLMIHYKTLSNKMVPNFQISAISSDATIIFFQSIQLFWYFINVINNQSNTYHNNLNHYKPNEYIKAHTSCYSCRVRDFIK